MRAAGPGAGGAARGELDGCGSVLLPLPAVFFLLSATLAASRCWGGFPKSSAPGSKEKPSTAAAFPQPLPLTPLSRPFIFGAAARRALQGENRAEDTKHGLRGDQLNAVI